MSDQTSVFSEEQTTPTQETTASVTEQTPQGETQSPAPSASSDSMWADKLSEIKNERGEAKYKDLPTALDALRSSQEYIPQLKQDNEALRAELEQLRAKVEQQGTLEETIQRLTSQSHQPTQEATGLTPEQVQEMLEQSLTQREQAQSAKSNAQKVEQAITQMYGDKTKDVVAQRAKQLGITPAKLGALASESPDMVLALFDVKQSGSQGQPSSSSVNIPPIKPNDSNELKRPEKSLLRGAKSSDQREYMRQIQAKVYKDLGVQVN